MSNIKFFTQDIQKAIYDAIETDATKNPFDFGKCSREELIEMLQDAWSEVEMLRTKLEIKKILNI